MSCMSRWCILLGVAVISVSCVGETEPVRIDTSIDRCALCQKLVSDLGFAAQVVASDEEPALFDDIGCLTDYLTRHTQLPRSATAYVADHRTGEWVLAADAVFTKNVSLDTPTNSHIIAHASAASRDADPATRGGTDVTIRTLFPLGAPTGGAR